MYHGGLVTTLPVLAEDRNQVEIEPVSLRSLLPEDISEYYRYNGSLTTPGCFESVVWTVFARPKPISHRQVSQSQLWRPPDCCQALSYDREALTLPSDKCCCF